ncbi:MAG: 4Fe-4S binding protein [Longimicrobiales bacterium]
MKLRLVPGRAGHLRTLLTAWAALGVTFASASAQRITELRETRYRAVMPEATRFGAVEQSLPVVPAYGPASEGADEVLIGYVFHTADLPPERIGYSGPIETLVGMDLEGRITGARIIDYWESHRSSLGDFLRRERVADQFTGKHIGDPFRTPGDIRGVSRATISVRALARGVRDAARQVARVYLSQPEVDVIGSVDAGDLSTLSWLELERAGVVRQFAVSDRIGGAQISLIYAESDAFAEYLVGPAALASAKRAMEGREGPGHLMLYGVEGSRVRLFVRNGWSVVQGGDTFPVPRDAVRSFGLAGAGMMAQQVTLTGFMILDGAIDPERPFGLRFRQPADTTYGVEYETLAARQASSSPPPAVPPPLETPPAPPVEARSDSAPAEVPVADPLPEPPAESAPARVEPPVPEVPASDTLVASGVAPPSAVAELNAEPGMAEQQPPEILAFEAVEERSGWARLMENASPFRLALLALVLSLATGAFFLKREGLRWVSLAATVVLLGFVDGGFLSVSHITSGIWSGGRSYAADLSLLLLVTFPVVTTLIWGRVFCGFLCPFGALQDFLDWLVPEGLKRRLPDRVHQRAYLLKYGVLLVVLVPAAMGSRASIYQFVEPFGTVFLFSPSGILWTIALAFLALSAVIPRFYCRYVCPLGAALALGSLFSIRRIRRVEHCDYCQVCEQSCPTRAIKGPEIDFKECVRCNICEAKLRDRAGVCRHDIQDVRSRLIQIEVGTGG